MGQENVIRKLLPALRPSPSQKSKPSITELFPKKALKTRTRRFKKALVRNTFVIANIALIFLVTALVWGGHNRAAQENSSRPVFSQGSVGAAQGPLDTLSSADIAANIARAASLSEVDSVTNQADSYTAKLATVTTDETVIAKPQLVNGGSKSRKFIEKYVTVQGDTLNALATKFGITSDSIRWSNGLSGDAVAAGKELLIPPSNGIVYKVASGDTIDALVAKYRSNKEQFIMVNDIETTGLPVGEYILIPGGVQPAPPRPTYTSGSYSGFAWGSTAIYGGNGYTAGYCTWHAANRRIEIGRPLPRNLGNAATWAPIAQNAGLTVSENPIDGAVLWHRNTGLAGGLGHVAFVERVNADGTILVSDMNYPYYGRVTYRTIPPSEFGQYKFIW